MSDDSNQESTEQPETGDDTATREPKPTETVEFWKRKAREQEKRAKDNASAATRLAELEDAQKSEIEKANDRVSAAEQRATEAEGSLPAKVADALKTHLVNLHQIDDEDAELFLTATDPELLLKQVTRLLDAGKRGNNHVVRREGTFTRPPADSEEAAFAAQLFGG